MPRPHLPRASDFLPRSAAETARPGTRQRGQALVLFVLMSLVLVGSVAIVTDVSWLWYGQQRMQRAADAAALAGAIYLPGDTTTAYSVARAESAKNGITNGVGGYTVTPLQDSRNRRRLIVTISGPVGSYFARVFGVTTFNAAATGRAEYVLPVPMGSPQNYYGLGLFVGAHANTNTNTSSTSGNSGFQIATTWPSGTWTNPSRADGTQNTSYAVSPATPNNNTAQQFAGFPLTSGGPNLPVLAANQTMTINGIQLEIRGLLTGSGTATGCTVTSQLSYDDGSSFSTAASQTFTTTKTTYTQGSAGSTSAWGGHTWVRSDFNTFRVRLTWVRTGSCATTRSISMDTVRVRVYYTVVTTTTTTTYTPQTQSISAPGGGVLAPQNFWASMQSQGAPSVQGDAYLTKYETRTSTANAAYDYDSYYNYGVDIPAGATNGKVYIFDPGMCEVGTTMGTGENWTTSGGNGYSPAQPQSSYFDLWDTQSTPYDISDDALVASSNNDFRTLTYDDDNFESAGGTSGQGFPDCGGLAWHNDWWLLASGLNGGAKGKTFRVHTYTTDTSALSNQNNTTALNSFAIYASASGGTPKVYGIGSMEAYVRLPGGTASEFYLAQIEDVHAGKTMVIDLWDPGDTGSLSASLQILMPTSSDYVPATFSYTAAKGTTNSSASDCNSRSGTNVTAVTTNTGGTSLFNGCWITITIALPTNYSAPHPSTDSVTSDGGWWKIRYTMGGAASSFSTDLTTWKVAIRGNPVHLVQ